MYQIIERYWINLKKTHKTPWITMYDVFKVFFELFIVYQQKCFFFARLLLWIIRIHKTGMENSCCFNVKINLSSTAVTSTGFILSFFFFSRCKEKQISVNQFTSPFIHVWNNARQSYWLHCSTTREFMWIHETFHPEQQRKMCYKYPTASKVKTAKLHRPLFYASDESLTFQTACGSRAQYSHTLVKINALPSWL